MKNPWTVIVLCAALGAPAALAQPAPAQTTTPSDVKQELQESEQDLMKVMEDTQSGAKKKPAPAKRAKPKRKKKRAQPRS